MCINKNKGNIIIKCKTFMDQLRNSLDSQHINKYIQYLTFSMFLYMEILTWINLMNSL